MKLNELFTTKERSRGVNSFLYDKEPKTLDNSLNSGGFGYVSDHKSDPHLIRKTAINYSNFDAYYEYAKALVSSKLAQHNPYAPRFYKIDHLKDKMRGKVKYNADMEKLDTLRSCSRKELLAIWYKITGKEFDSDKAFRDEEFSDTNDIAPWIADQIEDFILERAWSPDEHLTELCELIRNLISSLSQRHHRPAFCDMKPANLMVRRTPYGPQLVITDPIA